MESNAPALAAPLLPTEPVGVICEPTVKLPLWLTLKAYRLGNGVVLNPAVTARSSDIVTVQVVAVPQPEAAPPQPVKVEPAAGEAFRVTDSRA